MIRPSDYLVAARVPESVKPEVFGAWEIRRDRLPLELRVDADWRATYTLLLRQTMATLHMPSGEVVMEDSYRELRRHLPIWLAARGEVLITGLGLGCVVRGLLLKAEVTSVDVVELDAQILKRIGPEFEGNPRVRLHHADAFSFPVNRSWDFAWHDIWTENTGALTKLHVQLMARFRSAVRAQGAWGVDKRVKRLIAKVPGFGLGLRAPA